MASALNVHGPVKILGKGAVSAGTAYLLAKGFHGKKDATSVVPVGLAIGGKVLPAIASLFWGEDLGMAGDITFGAIDAAGQGALDFLAICKGLQHAREKKGLRAVALPASADLSKLQLPQGNVTDAALVGEDIAMLGALGRAQPGSTLDADKMRTLQTYR